MHRVTALPVAATCIGLGAALMVFGVAGAQSAKPTGLELFEAMMPVFTDDRCMNCHGVLDPSTGTEHAGGVVADGMRGLAGHRRAESRVAGHLRAAAHVQGRPSWRLPRAGSPRVA